VQLSAVNVLNLGGVASLFNSSVGLTCLVS